MPSPFPGMDPFLESPVFFPGLHGRLIAYMAEALKAVLPEPYYAEIYERIVVEESGRRIEPDVDVIHRKERGDREAPHVGEPYAPTATLPLLVMAPDDDLTETFVEILAARDGIERTVTMIEILSPSNKRAGSHARDLYLRKQKEVLQSESNLVEIDLLRTGDHSTAVPRGSATNRAGQFDYHACVSRHDRKGGYELYPIRLRDPLPTLSIPLLPAHRDVPLDLQAVFNRSYDAGPYDRRVRYQETSPEPPLSVEDAAWVAERLKAAGK